MKRFILVLLLPLVAFAASEQRIEKDKVVIGRPSPAGDPVLEFKSTTQRIKANRTTGRMQFTNDGTNFKNIGSGSGGAGGVNLLTDDNGDFEAGDTAWTESGGTFSIETTNPLFGVGSGKWDSSASSQTLISNLKTIEKGMVGRTCLAEMVYKWPSGVANDLSFEVLDASSNIILTSGLTPSTGDDVLKVQRNFDCGALGSQYRIRILSNVANPAEIIIDNVFLGSDSNSVSVSQASMVGESIIAGTVGCLPQRTSSTLGAFGNDAQCPGPTIVSQKIGNWLTTDVDNIVQTINDLPPGTYRVTIHGMSLVSAVQNTVFAVSDGTTTCPGTRGASLSANVSPFTVDCIFTYSSAGNRTFTLFGKTESATTVTISNDVTDGNVKFLVERFPLASAEAITLETTGSLLTYYHRDDCSWTIASGTTTFSDPAAGDATCTNGVDKNRGFTGVSSFLISGNPGPGILFTPPAAADYHVCAAAHASNNTASGDTTLQLTDAAGNQLATSWFVMPSSGGNSQTVCGILSATGISQQTVKIRMGATGGTGQLGQGGATSGVTNNNVIYWSIFPVNQQMPAPVFTALQNLTKSSNTAQIEYVSFGGATEGTTVCTASPCTMYRNSAGVTSVTRNSTGNYTVNFSPGTFTNASVCYGIASASGVGTFDVRPSTSAGPSNTTWNFTTTRASTEVVGDTYVMATCIGTK